MVAPTSAGGPVPLFVFDAGYDPVPLTEGLAATRAAILVRLRRDRCFYADPTSQPGTGRPRCHGAKFACADPATRWAPSDECRTEDDRYGAVRVRAWAELHPKQQHHAGRGSRKTRPVVRGTLVLVEVGRLPRPTQPPKQLWLWWAGPGAPDLDTIWRAYVHRFDLEHTLRFAKQTLLWTTGCATRSRRIAGVPPGPWLVVAACTMLRLAKTLVCERRLPWERPRPPHRLTPYRVRRAVSGLLVRLGTPARPAAARVPRHAIRPSRRPLNRPRIPHQAPRTNAYHRRASPHALITS